MKVLGILGGMGPLPTIKLFEMIVSMTDANNDQEHIHIIIDNNTKIPDRTSFLLDSNKENPVSALIESAKRLENAGVNLIVMPCNTAHYYYKEIQGSIDVPFLNMIEETAVWIKEKHPELNRIGLLATDGTIRAEIYDNIFKNYEIEIVKPSVEKQKHIYELIYNMKENKEQKSLDGIYSSIREIESQGVEIFIAGCTEVSVALDAFKIQGKFIDPMKIIAEKAIELVGAKLRTS